MSVLQTASVPHVRTPFGQQSGEETCLCLPHFFQLPHGSSCKGLRRPLPSLQADGEREHRRAPLPCSLTCRHPRPRRAQAPLPARPNRQVARDKPGGSPSFAKVSGRCVCSARQPGHRRTGASPRVGGRPHPVPAGAFGGERRRRAARRGAFPVRPCPPVALPGSSGGRRRRSAPGSPALGLGARLGSSGPAWVGGWWPASALGAGRCQKR